jgi:hypothetical protein
MDHTEPRSSKPAPTNGAAGVRGRSSGGGVFGGAPASFFAEHAITEEIARARPYVRWEKGDGETMREAYKLVSEGSRRTMVKYANREGGWIITRHPPSGLGLSPIVPEIRPDNPVKTSQHWQYHPSEPSDETPVISTTGQPLSERNIHSAASMRKHIKKHHGGVNVEDVHPYENCAKYLFPSGDGAMRIDVHPLALPLIRERSRVFFVIEGCIKADAILSAGEAVLSVPSVTLWNAPELRRVAARYLSGKTVYIVPDNDWVENPLVITQAMLLRSFLRRLGIEAHIASPPYPGPKGVDDLLAAGGTVDDLLVFEREAPAGLPRWIKSRSRRRDTARRDAEIAESLVLHAENGIFYGSPRKLATIWNMQPKSVARAVQRLLEMEAVAVDKPLEIARWQWVTNEYRNPDWEWVDRPTITIRPELRAIQGPPKRLGDLDGEILRATQDGTPEWVELFPGRNQKRRTRALQRVKRQAIDVMIWLHLIETQMTPKEISRNVGVSEDTVRRRKEEMLIEETQQDRIEGKLNELLFRSAEIMEAIRETALRLPERCPGNEEITEAVDRFLAQLDD